MGNPECGQAKRAISLILSALVPKDALGLMQKMTDKLLGH